MKSLFICMIHKEAMLQAFPVTILLLQASCIEHTFQQTCLNLKKLQY